MKQHSICFSLGDPRDNKYIQCMEALFHSLSATDTQVVTVDPETETYLKTLDWTSRIQRVIRDKPVDLLEGMTWKQELNPNHGETIVQIDLDMLRLRPFSVEVPPDTVVVCPEGSPTDTNQCGSFQLTRPQGATAGFFVYRQGPQVSQFFQKVCELVRARSEQFYTLDQPQFNLHLPPNTQQFPYELISFNGNGDNRRATFVNFAGNPGDDHFHWEKIQTWKRFLKSRREPFRVGLFHRM